MTVQLDERITSQIREVTDEEIAFYAEHGWVMLRGLVSAQLAAEMLRVAEPTTKKTLDNSELKKLLSAPDGKKRAQELFVKQLLEEPEKRRGPAMQGQEPFRSYVFSEQLGRNARRLINRSRLGSDVPVRLHNESVACKAPSAAGTDYHQDATEEGSDRAGRIAVWLALDEVTPEMGAMRFLNGVHREGPLGIVLGDDKDMLGLHPKLTEVYEMSPPFRYQPGDATVHHGYMVHGTPPNTTDRSRWSYIVGFVPADTRYIHGRHIRPCIDRHEPADVEAPIVYTGY